MDTCIQNQKETTDISWRNFKMRKDDLENLALTGHAEEKMEEDSGLPT